MKILKQKRDSPRTSVEIPSSHVLWLLQKMSGFLSEEEKRLHMTKAGCVPFLRITKSKLYVLKDISFSKQACFR